MSMKKATPRFSLRASALAAPKKLDPTIRPRATSSAHSTGALNRKRSSTEPQTTSEVGCEQNRRHRVAEREQRGDDPVAAASHERRGACHCASDLPTSDLAISGLRRADHVHHGLGFGARLDEIIGLRQHALAERFVVAFDHRDALVLDQRRAPPSRPRAHGCGCRPRPSSRRRESPRAASDPCG